MLLAAFSDDFSQACNITGLRAKLKAATAAAHHALDERLSAFDLTQTEHYRRFLQVNAAALLPLEAMLEQAGVADLVDDWSQRSRARAITADLARLGGAVVPLPMPATSSDRSAMFGTLYVLEGARLGAAYLLRIALASADPRVRAATNYLGHGAGQGLWRSFLARLEREAVTPDEEARMIGSAEQAFAMFTRAAAAA
jgi:heme oxygenase (biliverdin-IX-beta and delta-forming)